MDHNIDIETNKNNEFKKKTDEFYNHFDETQRIEKVIFENRDLIIFSIQNINKINFKYWYKLVEPISKKTMLIDIRDLSFFQPLVNEEIEPQAIDIIQKSLYTKELHF